MRKLGDGDVVVKDPNPTSRCSINTGKGGGARCPERRVGPVIDVVRKDNKNLTKNVWPQATTTHRQINSKITKNIAKERESNTKIAKHAISE